MEGARTPDDVARRLAGTALAGAPLTEVPLPEAPGATWVIDLGGGDVVAAWREARDAVAGLGLYPVAVTTWGLPDWEADLSAASTTVATRTRRRGR